MHQRRNEE